MWLGLYSGDLYVFRLDNKTKSIVEESRIDLENYPFKPVVGIAESPEGDVYFGAYAIFKLNATDIDPKREYLFPIEINSSKSSVIQGINFSPAESRMVIELNNQADGESMLGLKIPIALMNNVAAVIDLETNRQIPFQIDNSTSLPYNSITLQVPPVPHLQIAIVGSTLATPGEQVLRG